MEGDAAFRRGRFAEAREFLEEAIREDSTFALAYWRLGETIGWTDGIGAPEGREAKQKAERYGDRLPAREAALLRVGSAVANNRALDIVTDLRSYLARYPDDPDGWYMLGEVGLHAYAPTGVTDAEVEQALLKAIELDPTFGPYHVHAITWVASKGQEGPLRRSHGGRACCRLRVGARRPVSTSVGPRLRRRDREISGGLLP